LRLRLETGVAESSQIGICSGTNVDRAGTTRSIFSATGRLFLAESLRLSRPLLGNEAWSSTLAPARLGTVVAEFWRRFESWRARQEAGIRNWRGLDFFTVSLDLA
jgi:hypothetical protein